MLKLFQPKRAFGLPCPSAFCVKLETYLRMADIPYELMDGEPTDAPKGKVPWIEDGPEDNRMSMGDSSFIIDYLKQTYGDPLDSVLSNEQQATGRAVQRMLEESLYFVSSYSKWVDDGGFKIYSAQLFGHLPEDQMDTVPPMVRDIVTKKLKAQGIARHSSDEVYAIGIGDIQAFATLLGDKPYLFGDSSSSRPTSFDCCALGVIGNIKDGPFDVPIRDEIRGNERLSAYIDRMRSTYFADLA